jgi:hypothetical protein
MDILKSHKTVVGLFDSAKDIEDIMDKLIAHELGEDDTPTIIDHEQFKPEIETEEQVGEGVASPAPGTITTAGPAVVQPTETPGTDRAIVEKEAKATLVNLGVDNEEANFFARQVARGSTLLVVKTSETTAAEAKSIIDDKSSRSSIS